jgi:heme-degrading monooxygenase HmoA
MAYLMTHFWKGGTEEQYGATVAAVHPADGLPAGQRSHTAGPTDGGYLISVVWDSKDAADAFVKNTLMPAMPVEGGFSGSPEERTAEVVHDD